MLRRSTLASSLIAATALSGAALAASPSASAAAAPMPTKRASSSANIPCGFGLTTQSYKNCTGKPIVVVAYVHESATGKIFHPNYCLNHLDVQKPLGMPGMWAWGAVHAEKKKGDC